jgi:hypothetical protein
MAAVRSASGFADAGGPLCAVPAGVSAVMCQGPVRPRLPRRRPGRERDLSKALTDNLARFLRELGTGFALAGAGFPLKSGDREFFLDLLLYHCKLHRYVVFEPKLGRFEPEHAAKLNFYVQLVVDHLRDQSHDDPTLCMLLVVGRDDVTVEVALRGISTPLAVTEWRRLSAKVRQTLLSPEDLTATLARTVREIESSTAGAGLRQTAAPEVHRATAARAKAAEEALIVLPC